MSNQYRVTAEGLKKLQDELSYLRDVKRAEVVAAIELARSYGDLSENSEYDEAKAEQGKVESRIQELEAILSSVVVVADHEIQTNVVDIGVIVTVLNKTRGINVDYTIVGATEANPLIGKISDRSPIGKAILNRKVGETVTVETPAGIVELEILNIRK